MSPTTARMQTEKKEIYISLDLESDGPCAGLNNMLTLGAAAFNREGKELDQFEARLLPLADLHSNPRTLAWWKNQSKDARQEAFGSPLYGGGRMTAEEATIEFAAWLMRLQEEYKTRSLIPMAWPASFDFPFVNYYFHRFYGENPLGFACLDMRSYVMGLCRQKGYYDLKESDTKAIFGEWDQGGLTEHVAVDDAIQQGRMFFYIRNSEKASPELIREPASKSD